MEENTNPSNDFDQMIDLNGLDKKGYDPKNRLVQITVTEETIHVTKENCDHLTKDFDDYESAEDYFEFLITCSQN